METTILGRTGLVVSRLGFGGAPAGLRNYLSSYSPDDAEQRRTVIRALSVPSSWGSPTSATALAYGQEQARGSMARRCRAW